MNVTLSRCLMAVSIFALSVPVAAQEEEDQSAIDELDNSKPAAAPVYEVPGAAELRDAMRRIASRPTDSYALTDAGNAALLLGDANAALNFFTRANSLQPSNGRIKMGLAIASVRTENPFEALRLFDEAVRLGVAERTIAGDRALAHDLLGNFVRAQQDYSLARTAGVSDGLIVQQAISLSIGGRQSDADAMLNPLLKRNVPLAWRARAFLLAARGDYKESVRVTQGFMDARSAQQFERYLRQMPELTGAQQAAAIHLGHFPANNIGRDSEAVRAVASSYPVQGAAGAGRLIPSGQPLGSNSAAAPVKETGKERKARLRAEKLAAKQAKNNPVAAVAVPDRSVRIAAGTGTGPGLATDIARSRILEAEQASVRLVAANSLPPPDNARPLVTATLPPERIKPLPLPVPAPTPAPTPIPAPVAVLSPASNPLPFPPTAASPAQSAIPAPAVLKPAAQFPVQTPAPIITAPKPAPILTPPSPTQTEVKIATVTRDIQPPPILPPRTNPAPIITQPASEPPQILTPASAAPSISSPLDAPKPQPIPASVPTQTPAPIVLPAQTAVITSAPTVTPNLSAVMVKPQPEVVKAIVTQPGPLLSPPAPSLAATAPSLTPAPVQVPVPSSTPAPVPAPINVLSSSQDSVPAIPNLIDPSAPKIADAQIPAASDPLTAPIAVPETQQPEIAQPIVAPAPAPAPAFSLDDVVSAIEIPESEQQRSVVPVNLKTLKPAAPKLSAAEQAAADKAKIAGKTGAKNPEIESPARYWVQIATGNASAFSGDIRNYARKYPVQFKGQNAWSSQWGNSSRLVIGPFADLKGAKKWEADYNKAGGKGFVWRSEKGTEVKPLKGK